MYKNKFFDITLNVDLSKIQKNYKTYQEQVAPAKTSTVLKADAYGLGVGKIFLALLEVDCQDFFVATLGEGIFLRNLSKKGNIYILNGIKYDEIEAFAECNLVPVLNDLAQINIWNDFAKKQNQKFSAILHIETGLNRQAISFLEVKKIAKTTRKILSNIDVLYVIGHLACANQIDNVRNKEQLNRFKEIIKLLPNYKYSLVNSSGIFLGKEYHFDLVRPGAGLFGINPTPYFKANPMEQVFNLMSKVIHIKKIEEDGMVGYGNICPVAKNMVLATVPIGYADGYLRSLSNKSYVYIKNKSVPVLGYVSMDMIMIDISSFKKNEIKIGDEVEIIGENVKLSQLASRAETISYEIIASLGHRCRRNYLF